MNRQPFVSVVVPTYNRAEQLADAIDSILAQTYRRFEIVVVDDGSTDHTREKVRALIDANSEGGESRPPIRYVYQLNAGPSAARNRGVEEAAGDWIAFLDSDDVWLPEKLSLQINAIEHFGTSCGLCFTDAHLVDRSGLDTNAFEHAGVEYKELHGMVADPGPHVARDFSIWVQTVIVRRDLARQVGGFDSDLHFGEDYDFLFRLGLATHYCYVNKPLVLIDRTTVAIDPTVAPRRWDEFEVRLQARQYMYEKWLKQTQHRGDLRRVIVDKLRDVHSNWTNWYLETQQFDRARRAASVAMSYRPTPLLTVKCALTWLAPQIARKIIPKAAA